MERLNHAIEQLPEKCKMAFKLIRIHNLSYDEVANIMNISKKDIGRAYHFSYKTFKGNNEYIKPT
jgi:RNA polymerase sigma-70 factor (ECF subfamily)